VHKFAVGKIKEERCPRKGVNAPAHSEPPRQLGRRVCPRGHKELPDERIPCDLLRNLHEAKTLQAKAGQGHPDEIDKEKYVQLVVDLLGRTEKKTPDSRRSQPKKKHQTEDVAPDFYEEMSCALQEKPAQTPVYAEKIQRLEDEKRQREKEQSRKPPEDEEVNQPAERRESEELPLQKNLGEPYSHGTAPPACQVEFLFYTTAPTPPFPV